MNNFNPPNQVLEKWTATRKAQMKLGSDFFHPRIFSTVGYSRDRFLFIVALVIEFVAVAVAVFFTGFNFIMIIGSCILVGFDLWLAFLLHKRQSDVNKLNCKLELAIFEQRRGLKNDLKVKAEITGIEASIDSYERSTTRYLIIIALVLIATLKIIFGFLALIPYGMAVAIGVPAFFYVAAYIHIKHTGYFNAQYDFLKVFAKYNSQYHAAVAEHKPTDLEVRYADITELEDIPENVKAELHKRYQKLISNDKGVKINDKNEVDENSNEVILYGENHIHKVVYNEKNNSYCLQNWGLITDNDLFELLNSYPIPENVKAYLGYFGLKRQMSELSEPKFSITKSRKPEHK